VAGIGDTTMGAVEYALRGLAQRADVRANNLANVNTPGFRAARVDFESALAGALAAGAPERAAPAVLPAANLPNPNGNTVNLEGDLVGMMKDNLLREAMVNAFNHKAQLLRSAIGNR
jgi:flagellar basal-body rod protein FlgB